MPPAESGILKLHGRCPDSSYIVTSGSVSAKVVAGKIWPHVKPLTLHLPPPALPPLALVPAELVAPELPAAAISPPLPDEPGLPEASELLEQPNESPTAKGRSQTLLCARNDNHDVIAMGSGVIDTTANGCAYTMVFTIT